MKIQKIKKYSFYSNGSPRPVRDIPFVAEPDIHGDERGYFFENYKDGTLGYGFENMSWCKQINMSSSSRFVFRGLHAQAAPKTQGKLIECVEGRIVDIIIDARPDSASFNHFSIFSLDGKNHKQLWVPRGFLHGFCSVEDKCVIMYKCDCTYSKDVEFSVNPASFFKLINNDVTRKELSFIKSSIEELTISKNLSQKDAEGMDYVEFMELIKDKWNKEHKLWYSSHMLKIV